MEKQIIEDLFAFVAEESPGDEGVIGMNIDMPGIGPCFSPLIGADMKRVDSLRIHAQTIGMTSNRKIILKRFKLVSTEEVIFDPANVKPVPNS